MFIGMMIMLVIGDGDDNDDYADVCKDAKTEEGNGMEEEESKEQKHLKPKEDPFVVGFDMYTEVQIL